VPSAFCNFLFSPLTTHLLTKIRHSAFGDILFPFIEKRPADGDKPLTEADFLTREQALERLERLPYDEATVAQEFEYVATKLGISVTELQSYLDAPNKTYKDYRSQQSLYAVGAKVMNLFNLELGGKR